jgi:hypothetical protein
MIYDVDWEQLMTWLIPKPLQGDKMTLFINVMSNQFNGIAINFSNYRQNALYRLNTNGQTCSLRKALNDAFDPTDRRITITNNPDGGKVLFAYPLSQEIPLYLPAYLGTGEVNFIVNVPAELNGSDASINVLIQLYKRPTKTYSVNYI